MVKSWRVALALCVLLGAVLGFGGRVSGAETPSQNDVTSLWELCKPHPNENGCRAGLPSGYYQLILDEMVLHPAPNVQPLPTNMDEVTRFAFRRVVNEAVTTIYDAPNGNPIGALDPGFNFVTTIGYQPGWVEINPGQWVREEETLVTEPSKFAGVLLDPTAMKYTMAWVLVSSRPAPYPGAEGDESRARVTRYTRVNIYATVVVDGWRWYLIGPDTWIIQTKVAKVQFTQRPDGFKGRWVAVDLYEQVLVAYDENDVPVYTTLISSGLPQWSTNEGTFQTWARIANANMSGAEGQTDFYRLENVPWTLYYDGEISLHGTYWHDGFGYRHSHGCVNMSLTDSHWLYHWTLDAGIDLPFVYVYSTGEYVEG